MKITERKTIFGFNRTIIEVLQSIMLFAILHSSFAVPAQIILKEYLYGGLHHRDTQMHDSLTYFDSDTNTKEDSLSTDESSGAFQKVTPKTQFKKYISETNAFYSDLDVGYIGIFDDKPIDDAKDNLFRFYVDTIPQDSRIFLQYELFGVEGVSSVSRSINDLPSTGGYIIKKNNHWTFQEEELSIDWIQKGTNTILFTAPMIKPYGYTIKNVNLVYKKSSSPLSLVLSIDSDRLLIKDRTLYLSGFIPTHCEECRVEVGGAPLSLHRNQFEGFVQLTDEQLKEQFITVSLFNTSGTLATEVIDLQHIVEADLILPFEQSKSTTEKLFESFQSNSLFTEGAGIVVPDSALVSTKEIIILPLRSKDIAPMNSGMINVTKAGGAFRFLPDGSKFEKQVQLYLEYDPSLIPAGYSEKDIKTFYFDTQSKKWVGIEKDSIQLDSRFVISNTNHFTDYINGIIQVPESPETAAFIPTMMSDIQAANPSSGMSLISPPTASQSGSAGVSYPLTIPAGRQGMQPQLNISYNSDGGNGFLGLGWSMGQSAISIDTRWGVPLLSDTLETEIYTLDGEQMMYPKILSNSGTMVDWMPHRHYDATSSENIYSTLDRPRITDAQFTLRKQGGFDKIERLGDLPSNYYWKVTHTNGSVSWYGGKYGLEENYVLKNSDNKVVYWSLYRVEDVHGNNINYYYTKEFLGTPTGINSNLAGGVFYYLNRITYTGHMDTDGGYTIEFIPDSTVRVDIPIDSKLGVKMVTTKLLSHVLVKHQQELIRRYNLIYDPNFSKFGKNRLQSIVEADPNNKEFYRHDFDYWDDLDDGNGHDVYFSTGVDVNYCDPTNPQDPGDGQQLKCFEATPKLPIINGLEEIHPFYAYINSTPIFSNDYAYFTTGFYGSNGFQVFKNHIEALYPSAVVQFNEDQYHIQIYIANTTEILTTITFNSINNLFSNSFVFVEVPCNSNFYRDRLNDFETNSMLNSIGFVSTLGFGNPQCPSFINTEFLISGATPIPTFNSYNSPLGSTSTKSESLGGYFGMIGFGCNWLSKRTTFGVGFGVSGSRTKAQIHLIDLNGDGLNDIVIQQEGQIRYRPHIVHRTTDSNGNEVISHGFGISRLVTGIDRFYYSTGKSRQLNFSFNSGLSLGWEKSNSTSTTNIYFTDANGDGLIDIVKNGLVYFNHVNPNGTIEFIPDSKLSENLVIVAEPVTVEEPDDDFEFTLPSYDVVKVWEAPADGLITIENDISLVDPTKTAVVTIEKRDATLPSQQCYSVAFTAPNSITTLFKYKTPGTFFENLNQNNVNDTIAGNCYPFSTRIKNFTLNNVIYTPNNNNLLFLSHGNSVQGIVNQCSGILPDYCPNLVNEDILLPNFSSSCVDFSVRSNQYETIVPEWFTTQLNQSGVPYSGLSFHNLAHNRITLNTNPNSTKPYAYRNYYNYRFSFYSPIGTLTGNVQSETNSNSSYWNLPPFPQFQNQSISIDNNGQVTIPLGIDVIVQVNGSTLGTFNLVQDFSSFQTAFENQYGNSYQFIAPTTENGFMVYIQMLGSTNFESIVITPVSDPSQSISYPFSVTSQCELTRPTVDQSTQERIAKYDFKPSQEAIDLGLYTWLAQGHELDQPIDEASMVMVFEHETDSSRQEIYRFEVLDSLLYCYDIENNLLDTRVAEDILKRNYFDFDSFLIHIQKLNKDITLSERKYRQKQAVEWLVQKSTIDSDAILSQSFTNYRQNSLDNTCQEPQPLCLLFGTELNASQQQVVNTITTQCNGQALAVEKGDRIYFRLHSNAQGNSPVEWNPRIDYQGSTYTGVLDQNGYDLYNSSYSDGFIVSQHRPFTVPGTTGSASVTWNDLLVSNPSDDVTFTITRRTISVNNPEQINSSETLFSQTIPASTTGTVVPAGLSNITFSDPQNITELLFSVESTSNVAWKDYLWRPIVTTQIVEQVVGENNTEGDLTTISTHYPIVDYMLYKPYTCGPVYSTFDVSQVNGGNDLSISPNYSGVFSSGDFGRIHLVVKNNGKLVGSRTLVVQNGTLQSVSGLPLYNAAIPLQTLVGSDIEIGFYVEQDESSVGGALLLEKLLAASNSLVRITYGSMNFNVPGAHVLLFHRYQRFGPMYRQWGQFFYNPAQVNGATSTAFGDLIQEEVLFYDFDLDAINALINTAEGLMNSILISEEDDAEQDLANLENLQQIYESLIQDGSGFLPPFSHRDASNSDKWIAFHLENYAAESSFRAAPATEALSLEYDTEPYNYQGLLNTGAVGINKISKSKGQNISGGGSYHGVGGNLSKSIRGSGELLTDYTDLNGDRYPDVVTRDKVQFTTRTGGLKAQTPRNSHEQTITLSRNTNFGIGVSGGLGAINDKQGGKVPAFNKISWLVNSTKPNTSIGISGNFSTGRSFTDSFWLDVNGDGLSDLVAKENNSIRIYLNNGGELELSSAQWVNFANVFESRANNIGGGVGLSLWNSSIQGGVSLTSSWNNTNNTFIDLNGDGLVDFVDAQGNLNVSINRGNRFLPPQTWNTYNLNRESVSVTASANVAFTIAPNIPIPFLGCIKFFALTASGTLSTSTNKTEKTILDFDGDGYPDLIEKISGTHIRVYHSRIRRTDKLKSVTNTLGGKFTLDYKVHTIDYDNPHPKWVLSSVEIEDGYDMVNDGQDIYRKEYAYENPRYDRRERDFFGFEIVKSIDYTLDEDGTQDAVYRTSVTKYHNRSYFLKGLVKETSLYKGSMEDNLLYSRTENNYEIRRLLADNLTVDTTSAGILPLTFDVGGTEGRRSAVVLLKQQRSFVYELGTSPLYSTSTMIYDHKGRISKYHYQGDPNNNQDQYDATISYHQSSVLESNNLIKIPKEILVKINGQLKRKRQTENIDESTGLIQTIKHFYTNDLFAQVDLSFDTYGNIIHVMQPENENGQRMEYKYIYDIDHHKYIVTTEDAFGYASKATYNPKFDVPEMVIDMSENKTIYKYDELGRLILVQGPKEIENQLPYTLKFEYFPKFSDLDNSSYQGTVNSEDFVPVALTRHYDPQHPNNSIDTYTFVDGLSRVTQVKKDVTINRNEDPTLPPVYIEMMSVSGAATYDEFGRVFKQFHPTVESKSYNVNFNYNQQNISIYSQSIYDELDRAVEVINEEGNSSYVDYSIQGNLHMTRSTVPQNDSQNIISMTFRDVNGRVVRTNNLESNGEIITEFSYNAIGELLSYTDDMDMTTSYKYDLLGRKLVLDHPDRGVVYYIYDDASNLIRLQTANLESENKFIQYKYDYNRLETIQYPEVVSGVQNISNVYYTYGEPGTGNQTGKLICQVDATGRQEYFYGTMGEVTSNIRTVVAPTPELPNRTFTTQFEYDSWNRLQRIDYPDGEKVLYFYDFGGNLSAVEGDHLYIERIDYDHYEQRRYLKYGNGTETVYDYTPELRRLKNMQVMTTNSEHLLNNFYDYDYVGNVTFITNTADIYSVNKMGGGYEHKFAYDELNRLVSASGNFNGHTYQGEIGNDFSSAYELSLAYNTTHGILNKKQTHDKNGLVYNPNTYDNTYTYFEGTHRVQTLVDGITGEEEYFGYDLNGNIRSQIQSSGPYKYYLWDESDRLRVVIDEPRLHHYLYDAGGQRVLKASSSMQQLYENGQLVDSSIQMGNYTTYPSAFLVVDSDGVYSKHYYAGTQRIAARVGQESADVLFQESKVPFCLTKGMPRTADELKKLQQEDLQRYLTLGGHTSSLRFESYRVAREVAEAVEESEPGYGQRAQDQIYYYHPDHLGTATFLTDANGLPYEFFLNLPFGETMAEQHSQTSDYQNRWKFTGHELDRETGLYYAGARYYDPRVSIWLSVDPLAEKFPNWNPYNYVMQNPINLIDPDGNEPVPWWVKRKESQWYYFDKKSFNSAALYNTSNLNSSAYKDISQRNDYYDWVDKKLSNNNIKWFRAAEIVTRYFGVGAADGINLWGINDSSEKFMKEGNKFLFDYNMKNAKSLINEGVLTGSFYSASGETISFDGKRGIELDYLLVEYEQTLVNSFITEYMSKNNISDADMIAIFNNISSSFKYSRGDIKEIMNKLFNGGKDFNFGNYKDRVILGQALIDKLHEKN